MTELKDEYFGEVRLTNDDILIQDGSKIISIKNKHAFHEINCTLHLDLDIAW